MATQTGSSDTFVEAKPGTGGARLSPGASTPKTDPTLIIAGAIGGLVLGVLIGAFVLGGGAKTVETQVGPGKLLVATGQDEAISKLRNDFQTLESDKRAATEALASAIRLDQIPARYRGKTTAETAMILANADAEAARQAAIPTLTNSTATGGVKPITIGTPGVPLKADEIKTLITQLDATIAKSPVWLTAYHKLGENAAFDDTCGKLARVLGSIGAIDDPAKVTLDQVQKAVRAVQRDNKLKDDAVVGKATWAAIKKLVDEKRKA